MVTQDLSTVGLPVIAVLFRSLPCSTVHDTTLLRLSADTLMPWLTTPLLQEHTVQMAENQCSSVAFRLSQQGKVAPTLVVPVGRFAVFLPTTKLTSTANSPCVPALTAVYDPLLYSIVCHFAYIMPDKNVHCSTTMNVFVGQNK